MLDKERNVVNDCVLAAIQVNTTLNGQILLLLSVPTK